MRPSKSAEQKVSFLPAPRRTLMERSITALAGAGESSAGRARYALALGLGSLGLAAWTWLDTPVAYRGTVFWSSLSHMLLVALHASTAGLAHERLIGRTIKRRAALHAVSLGALAYIALDLLASPPRAATLGIAFAVAGLFVGGGWLFARWMRASA